MLVVFGRSEFVTARMRMCKDRQGAQESQLRVSQFHFAQVPMWLAARRGVSKRSQLHRDFWLT